MRFQFCSVSVFLSFIIVAKCCRNIHFLIHGITYISIILYNELEDSRRVGGNSVCLWMHTYQLTLDPFKCILRWLIFFSSNCTWLSSPRRGRIKYCRVEAKLNVVKSKNSRKNYSWLISFYGPISFMLAFYSQSTSSSQRPGPANYIAAEPLFAGRPPVHGKMFPTFMTSSLQPSTSLCPAG